MVVFLILLFIHIKMTAWCPRHLAQEPLVLLLQLGNLRMWETLGER